MYEHQTGHPQAPQDPSTGRAAATAVSPLQLSTIVVKQQMKVVELKTEYELFDETGRGVGRVTQVGQSPLAVVARFFSNLDVALPVRLDITDAAGQAVLTLAKPWFRWTVQVLAGGDVALGSISKQVRLGKAQFALRSPDGVELGSVHARNWRAKDFALLDADGRQIGEVNKQWAGLRELFTTADTYVVRIDPQTPEPLRSLAVASCLTIDTIMKQKKA